MLTNSKPDTLDERWIYPPVLLNKNGEPEYYLYPDGTKKLIGREEPKGFRFNTSKPRMDLLPWDALVEVANHYTKGAKKYPARNWEQGLKWNEGCAASLARHLAKWSSGEDYELENLKSGEQIQVWHDEAMAWNALALIAYRLRGIGEDDRHETIRTPNNDRGSEVLLRDLPALVETEAQQGA